MPRFITVAMTAEIPSGAREVFEVEGLYIAVFNVGGTYYAIEDRCTHDDGPLAEGDLDGSPSPVPGMARSSTSATGVCWLCQQ